MAAAQTRQALVPPSTAPHSGLQLEGSTSIGHAVNQPGVLWHAAGNPAFLYWSFDFNETTGELVPMKQVAFGPAPSDDTGPGVTHYSFDLQTNQEAAYHSFRLSANAFYNGALVRAIADVMVSSEITHDTFAGRIGLSVDAKYPDAILNMVDFPNLPLHPDASYVLSLPIADRAAAWQARGFGKYIAFGYALRSGVQMDVGFSDMTRAEQRRAWGKLVADFGNAGGSIDIENAIRAAAHTGFMSLNATLTGSPNPQTPPSLQTLLDPTQLHQWIQGLITQASSTKVAHGLYLAPASGLAGGLDWDLPSWSQSELNEAATIANDSMRTLSQASVWNKPYSLRDFINVRPMPNSALSYGAALNSARADLVTAVQGLGTAIMTYMAGNNSSNSAVLNQLRAAKDLVVVRRTALDSVLVALDVMVDSLPRPQIQFLENYTPPGGNPDNLGHRFIPARFHVSSFAAFPVPGSNTMEDVVRHGQDSKSAISVREYDEYNHWYGLRTMATDDLRFPSVSNDHILSAGDSRGLHDFDVTFEFVVRESSSRVDGRIYDELGRACEVTIQSLAEDHSF